MHSEMLPIRAHVETTHLAEGDRVEFTADRGASGTARFATVERVLDRERKGRNAGVPSLRLRTDEGLTVRTNRARVRRAF